MSVMTAGYPQFPRRHPLIFRQTPLDGDADQQYLPALARVGHSTAILNSVSGNPSVPRSPIAVRLVKGSTGLLRAKRRRSAGAKAAYASD